MKVQINRPWFDASIFKNTSSYLRLDQAAISKGPGFLNVLRDTESSQDAKESALNEAGSAMLPAFPVAFLVAKDVSISLSSNATLTGSTSKYLENSSSIGVSSPPLV